MIEEDVLLDEDYNIRVGIPYILHGVHSLMGRWAVMRWHV